MVSDGILHSVRDVLQIPKLIVVKADTLALSLSETPGPNKVSTSCGQSQHLSCTLLTSILEMHLHHAIHDTILICTESTVLSSEGISSSVCAVNN